MGEGAANPRRDEGRPAAAAGPAGAAVAERRRVRDRRGQPGLRRRAESRVSRRGENWTLAAIDYEPWGYTYNKPNTDLAAGHLLYAIGWAYDLLYDDFTAAERARIRASLERHAGARLRRVRAASRGGINFTQNHDFIPTAGLAVTALALMGESKDAEKWAALARAHHHRAGQLLSPDGYYYEGLEYLDLLDAVARALPRRVGALRRARACGTATCSGTGRSYLAHALLPDGQNVFDFGDIWEGALTRAKAGAEYAARLSGRHAAEQFQRHVPRRRASPAIRRRRPWPSATRRSATATSRSSGRCSGAIRR